MSKWQPIETAPKDGTPVVGCTGSEWHDKYKMWMGPRVVYYGAFHPNRPGKVCWRNAIGNGPTYLTHWMSLPEPPKDEALQ